MLRKLNSSFDGKDTGITFHEGALVEVIDCKLDDSYRSGISVHIINEEGFETWCDASFITGTEDFDETPL